MSETQRSVEVPYPPAPWRSRGCLWMGLFKTDIPVELPDGLRHLLNPHWLVVSLVRYLEGTLRYDELAIGSLARRGAYIGIFIQHIWVNDWSSLFGGRHIWGLPKEMANFTWDDNLVRVTDEDGLIATLIVDTGKAWSPRVWMPAPGIGRMDEQWTFTVARLWAYLRGAGMRFSEWSVRFTYRLGKTPIASFALEPFLMTVPPPRLLSD